MARPLRLKDDRRQARIRRPPLGETGGRAGGRRRRGAGRAGSSRRRRRRRASGHGRASRSAARSAASSASKPHGRDDDELGLGAPHVVPGRRVATVAGPAEEGLAARGLDHLGQPVAGAERRVDPLGEEDPRRGKPRTEARGRLDRRRPHLRQRVPRPAPGRRAAPRASRIDAATPRASRVERDHVGADRAGRTRARRARDGADRAQVLGDDHIGCERVDQLGVDA